MARPKSKRDLLVLSKTNFTKLKDYVDSMPDTYAELPNGYLNRNVRDVLAHLHHWHIMMLDWYDVGMSGGVPAMLAEGYTWRTVPDRNRVIWSQYTSYSLGEIRDLLELSYMKIRSVIQQHSDDDLFTKKKYKWTGSTSLGAYLISATSSHYDWAIKLIKKI